MTEHIERLKAATEAYTAAAGGNQLTPAHQIEMANATLEAIEAMATTPAAQ